MNFSFTPHRAAVDILESGVFSSVFMAIFFGLLTLWLVVAAAGYFFGRLGLYKMAKNAGIPNSWAVFIPLANVYYMGLLAERSIYVSRKESQPIAMVYLVVNIAVWAVGAGLIFALGWMSGIVVVLGNLFLTAAKFYCLYYIYKDYAPENDILFTVLGVIPFATAVLFIIHRDVIPVSVAGRRAGGQPKYTERRSSGSTNNTN